MKITVDPHQDLGASGFALRDGSVNVEVFPYTAWLKFQEGWQWTPPPDDWSDPPESEGPGEFYETAFDADELMELIEHLILAHGKMRRAQQAGNP